MYKKIASNEPLVAIVGEPNVGKSTLLNKIMSSRAAITSNVPGTTRDRFYASTSWNGVDFTLIDTAGIMLDQKEELERNIQKQVQIAIEQAELILYVVDGKKTAASFSREILKMLRRNKKNIILAVNKTDSPKEISQAIDKYRFTGIKKVFPVSAVSGLNLGDLLDEISSTLKKNFETRPSKDTASVNISIVGKQNVGKSSLLNAILGEERVVVSNVPGTTRNVIDTLIDYKGKKVKFLDTAGLKRRQKKAPLPDIYASFQTIRAIHKSDVCILVIDAAEGISQQDQRIAGDIAAASKGMVLAANKIDALSKKDLQQLKQQLPEYFPFLWWVPAVPISAKTGAGIKDVLDFAIQISETRKKEIDANSLNKFLLDKLRLRPPQRIRDERIPKIFSLRQVGIDPPVFEMTVNKPSAISNQFKKFIQNSIVKELDFWGTPVSLKLKAKAGI